MKVFMDDFQCCIIHFPGFEQETVETFGLVYWGLTPQQQPGSYQGGEMMMKSVFWWRKREYPEETIYTNAMGEGKGLHTVLDNDLPR